ncbi:mitochondrial carrier [Irpex rosettiformis]|uniref:Mitochondrial carrier n=1 Tax=Irpex rosettiformis TaxID=378272 RepID=A0ACB8UG93_9APHY|nr:mitochondrial carrier [Irpex rosettiformis]
MSTVSIIPIEEKVDVLKQKNVPVAKASKTQDYAMKFVSAALSNMAASGVSNPQDVIKVRQQLRTHLPGGQKNAFWSVGAEMARAEGVKSLMNGFTASMLREMFYSGLRLGGYEFFKDKYYAASNGALTREGITLKVLAAATAASLGSAIANPADLVKVRMQAYYPNGSPYKNTRHAFASIFREGIASSTGRGSPILAGLGALYKGVVPTIVRGVVLSASQICSYDQVKQTLKKNGVFEEGIQLHMTASLFAGLFCSITSNPVDVVKVRSMTDKTKQFHGVVHCIRTILVNEGPLAFYKGFGMCWGRLGTHTIVSFLAFERLRKLFGMDPM